MPVFNITRIAVKINKSPFCSQYACQYHGKINTVAKRGSMLIDMIANRDKRKHWHLNIMPTKPKVRVFEKIHKPFRRRAVLNSLFISNITDVLSTGDVVPDLVNYGIEITGVSVSQCMKILNVFWQVPPNNYESCTDIDKMLTIAAPKIRAELISRNVLGRVPHIFFLRDATNERIAEYELAAKKMEAEPKIDTGIVPDDSFSENLYQFKDNRKSMVVKEKSLTEEKEIKKDVPTTPYKPIDMKSDVCGLNHALLMDKVIALKKKTKDPLQHTNVISPETMINADDLFSKIPGVCFQAGSSSETESRDAILKKFHIARKMLKEKHKDKSGDPQCYEVDETEGELNSTEDSDDFIDEETADNER